MVKLALALVILFLIISETTYKTSLNHALTILDRYVSFSFLLIPSYIPTDIFFSTDFKFIKILKTSGLVKVAEAKVQGLLCLVWRHLSMHVF